MTPNDQITLESIDSMSRYNRWIANQFSGYWGKNILEVGCGLGTLSKLLPKKSKLTLVDINNEYTETLKTANLGEVICCDIQHPPLSLRKATFDTVFSSNVLEHIENDQLALKNIYNLLKENGHLLLFVPAKQVLYGELDKQLKHYRRYEKNSLERLLNAIGFGVKVIQYTNLLGFFSWWVSSRLLKQKYISPKLGVIYDYLFVPLLRIEGLFRLPFGQNLMVIAQKL